MIEDDERAAMKKPSVPASPTRRILNTAAAARELDLRGMETLEAESVLENYLDAARRAHLETVTIIHGKGTGALRKAVQSYLRRDKTVKSFRLGRLPERNALFFPKFVKKWIDEWGLDGIIYSISR